MLGWWEIWVLADGILILGLIRLIGFRFEEALLMNFQWELWVVILFNFRIYLFISILLKFKYIVLNGKFR